jgi:anti-sigma B factor antagonist
VRFLRSCERIIGNPGFYLNFSRRGKMPIPTIVSPFSVEVERKGALAIAHCRGRLVAGVGHVLYNRVRELLPASKCIVIDLTDVGFVDSMGLGTLVRIYVSAKGAGSRVELVNLGKQIRELLGITNLLAVFGEGGEKGAGMNF